ncbi:MAG: hypothetical protein EP298_00575 [Gammaproteobacteria bacterium]|nr:MAG: hypothetical protein EP298_00575 [Gammaproteobacteria bacterium]UTW41886.1 hypothetical protein KFE69_10280 [bacterium SCSIO 12844]
MPDLNNNKFNKHNYMDAESSNSFEQEFIEQIDDNQNLFINENVQQIIEILQNEMGVPLNYDANPELQEQLQYEYPPDSSPGEGNSSYASTGFNFEGFELNGEEIDDPEIIQQMQPVLNLIHQHGLLEHENLIEGNLRSVYLNRDYADEIVDLIQQENHLTQDRFNEIINHVEFSHAMPVGLVQQPEQVFLHQQQENININQENNI